MPTAIVLCGGYGTRLRKVVPDRPKCMADVNGKPFLEYIIKKLLSEGFNDIILCTSYKHSIIKHHFDKSPYSKWIHYSTEPKPSGTGNAIRKVIKKYPSLPLYFLVINGDTYTDMSYHSFNIDSTHSPTMALSYTDGSWKSMGIYILCSLSKYGKSLEKDIIPSLIKQNHITLIPTTYTFTDIGTPDGYKKIKQILKP